MRLSDEKVAELYGFDTVIGKEPTPKNVETDVVIPYPNPYSLNNKYSEGMKNQQGGKRRTRKYRKARKGTRRGRRHH
jgi:hypothetical protein